MKVYEETPLWRDWLNCVRYLKMEEWSRLGMLLKRPMEQLLPWWLVKLIVKQLHLQPIARLAACAVAGVDPLYMGIGPCMAIPKPCNKPDYN
jgi:acetyl-CoA acetyltransferase